MKLCLGTYLKIVVQCKNCTQKEIVGRIMQCFRSEFDETDDSMISNLVNGRKNPSKDISEAANEVSKDDYGGLVKYFKENVTPLLRPTEENVLRRAICEVIIRDNEIGSNVEVELVTKTTKENLERNTTDLSSFLLGIFLYVMKYTDNKDCNQYVKKINEDFFMRIRKKSKGEISNSTNNVYDEDTELAARKFCINYEKELELLPLCQIAYFINPCHKNIREIYTDYNTCSSKVRKRILELNKLPELDFSDKNWINRCIGLYEKRIVEMELTTINFWYEGTKYLNRAYEKHSECKIEEFEPYIFDRIAKSETIDKLMDGKELKAALGDYIADYLYYKDNRTKQKLIPPWDKVWDVCNLSNCPEYEVTFWVCKFIIDSCYFIDPIVFPKKSDIQVHAETNQINIHLGDSECLIDTQEDMYYYALLQLYKCFYNK